jgi:queuine tRNA-ribosyltransferase
LHLLLKTNNPLAAELVTQHNIAYMMTLVRDMRNSILRHEFAAFATNFVQQQFPGERQGGDECPAWVKNALEAAGVGLLK